MTYALKSCPVQAPAQPWRNILPIHPAAELLPRMSEAELHELGADIKRRGLQTPIAILVGEDGVEMLLDGINRLDAMELVGLAIVTDGDLDRDVVQTLNIAGNTDPFAYVLSANIHRRHLSREQKSELIAKLLKVKPDQSDRTIARQVKADHKTVAKIRGKSEARGEIPHVKTRTDSKGRAQPAKKQKPVAVTNTEPPKPPAKAELPVKAPPPEITLISQDVLELYRNVIIDLCEDDRGWPDPSASRRQRRLKAMKKLRAVLDELIELAKPAPRRGRPSKAEHIGATAP